MKSHFCKLSAYVKIKILYLSSVDVKWKQDDYETPFKSRKLMIFPLIFFL